MTPSIEMFKQYLKNQQDDFLLDGRRVELIIRGIFHEEKSLISLLTSTWEAGIVTELRQTANIEVTISQFGDRFCREYDVGESSVLTAVRVWAYVLGLTGVVPPIDDDRKISSSKSQPSKKIIAKTAHLTARADESRVSLEAASIAGRPDERSPQSVFITGDKLGKASGDVMVKKVQNNELMLQTEALERECQTIEVMTALEAEQKDVATQLEETRPPVETVSNIPVTDEIGSKQETVDTKIEGKPVDGKGNGIGSLVLISFCFLPIVAIIILIKRMGNLNANYTANRSGDWGIVCMLFGCVQAAFGLNGIPFMLYWYGLPLIVFGVLLIVYEKKLAALKKPKSEVRGTRIEETEPSAKQKVVMLYFYRPRKFNGWASKIRLFVNSEELSTISNNSTEILKVSKAGELEIGINALGLLKMKTVKTNAQFGKSYFFKVGYTDFIGAEIQIVPYESVKVVFPNAIV
jgi:hypothetical protein